MEFWTFVLYILTPLSLVALYKWFTSNRNMFEEMGLDYIKPGLLGNTSKLFLRQTTMLAYIREIYEASPKSKIVGLFDFRKPIYMLRDPQQIKEITTKSFENFSSRRQVLPVESDDLLGGGLSNLNGQKWHEMRITLSPVFSGAKMRLMFALLSEIGSQMSDFFSKNIGNGEFEMKDTFSRYTNDAIASCAFGLKVDSLKDPENSFYVFGKKVTSFSSFVATLKFLGYMWFPKIMKALKIPFIPKKDTDYFTNLIRDAIEMREKEGVVRPDVLNLLVQMRKDGVKVQDNHDEHETNFAAVDEVAKQDKAVVKKQWTETEMMAQMLLFFFAGFETSSNVMAYLAYELALSPEVQQKLYLEVDAINRSLGGKNLTYDELQKMKYMDCVVTEALRKYPAGPIIDRVCVKDYTMTNEKNGKTFTIHKGTIIWIPIYGLHMNPKYFEKPDKFDPERFNDENKANVPSGVYLPFGAGPRNCIGSRFALMEIKTAIYYLIRDFKFDITAKTDIPLQFMYGFGMQSKNGVWLKLNKRQY